jgi:hypothetical protein
MAKPRGPRKSNGETGTTRVETRSAAVETHATEPTTAEPKRSTLRPSIVKSDRASVLPINLDDEIRRLAYLLSERRGFEPGHESEDWLAAEREIRQRYHQHSA